MFPRSQRFKDDTRTDGPGPGDYDPVNDLLNPHKKYGFLDKSGRWTELKPSESSQFLPPSNKENFPSASTSTKHKNGATKRSVGTEEARLRRELDELREQFERQKLAAQRDADVAVEWLRKAEMQAREAIKERNGVQATVNAREHELAEMVAKYNASKANLEKAEKSALALSDKTAKTVAMQRRLDDLEKANAKLTDQLTQARKSAESDRRRHQSTVQDLSSQLEFVAANAARKAENTLADHKRAWTIECAAITEEATERQVALEQEIARRDAAIVEMREAARRAEEQSRERHAQAVKQVKRHEERAAEMQAWAKEMQSKVAAIEKQARQDGAAVAGLEDEVQRMVKERDEAARDRSLALRDLDVAQRDLEAARRKGDNVEAELAGRAAALRDALEGAERKVKRIEAELASRDVKIKEMEGGRVKQAEAEVGRLARVVTEKEKELVALRRRIEGGEGEAKRWQEVAVQAREMEEEMLAEKEKLHEQLQDSESRRTEIEEQLQSEVRFLMQKHSLAWDEMERVNGINAELMGHQNPRQRIKHVHKLKDENIALKKDNLALGRLRDEQHRKIMALEREVESLRALGPTTNPVASRSRVARHVLRAEGVMGGRSVIVADA